MTAYYWDEDHPTWRIFKMPDGSAFVEGPATNQKGIRVVPAEGEHPRCMCGWTDGVLIDYNPNCPRHLERYWWE